MITFDEAFARVVDVARPLGFERVTLRGAHGRVLAEPVVALVDSPPADVSAMDGYAVREADLGQAFRLIGESFPGAAFAGEVGAHEAVRIFTGAPIPAGADRVIVQEIVRRDGDAVAITGSWSASRHVRARGSDFRVGDRLLEVGRRLDPRAMVAAAGSDGESFSVWLRPRIAILGTGDELAEPGSAREFPGSIPESVSHGVAALVSEWGATVVSSERSPDDPAILRADAEAALDAGDLVVVTGGASVGEKDFAKPVFGGLGLELIFSKVSVRPGKPVWLGRVGSKLVMGLPGNPTSAMVTARLLLAPLVAGLSGRDPYSAARWSEARLAVAIGPCGDRETFGRARRIGDAVEPLGNQESGAQHVLSLADTLIRMRPGSPAREPGAMVEVIDF